MQGYDPIHLFVSSSVGLNKETGHLFAFALNALGITDTNSVLHIGDNEKTDVVAARKLGINAIHFRHLRDIDTNLASISGCRPKEDSDFISALVFGLSRRRTICGGGASKARDLVDIGYHSFGPAFAGWVLWLTRRVAELAPDCVLLFARDTQLIDRLVREGLVSFGAATVAYTYVSRVSLCFAAIRTLDEFSLRVLLPIFNGYTLGKFIELWLEHTPEEKGALIIPEGLNLEILIRDIMLVPLSDFIRANSPIFLAASVKHRKHVRRYLGRNVTGKKIVLIDIGWVGNMQVAWLNALGSKIDIKNVDGLYLALYPEAQKKLDLGHRMEGWLTSPQETSVWTRALWSGGLQLLELALSADHGTTLGYTKDEATPILAATDAEVTNIEACRALQRGMVEFWKDFKELLAGGEASYVSMQPAGWSAPLYRLIRHPMLHEVELLGDIKHRVSGGIDGQANPLAPKSSWHKRIIPWLRKTEKNSAFWKEGYRRRNRRIAFNQFIRD